MKPPSLHWGGPSSLASPSGHPLPLPSHSHSHFPLLPCSGRARPTLTHVPLPGSPWLLQPQGSLISELFYLSSEALGGSVDLDLVDSGHWVGSRAKASIPSAQMYLELA